MTVSFTQGHADQLLLAITVFVTNYDDWIQYICFNKQHSINRNQ